MKNKIEETKLTPEILFDTFCLECGEGDPDMPIGEKCCEFKNCLNGIPCDFVYFGCTARCGEYGGVELDDEGHPNCDGYKFEKSVDEYGSECETSEINLSKCITCVLKSEYSKIRLG